MTTGQDWTQNLVETVNKLAELQAGWTENLAEIDDNPPENPFFALIFAQHQQNHRLWKEEDKARAPEVADEIIANVKRKIDKLNQQRNDLIERINDEIHAKLTETGVETAANAPFNSETPGSIIDRMSIMSLKIYYMGKQTERREVEENHRETCRNKLQILREQKHDLAVSLRELLADLFAGRKLMKLYRQFKMYNDPNLNPEIYTRRESELS